LVAGKTNLTTAFSNLETAVSNQEKKETYMSKNIARKGLVFGALVALGSSVIAGAPAQAAELLTLAPSTGTSYNTVQGSNFVLETQFDSTISSSSVPFLKYHVTNDGAKSVGFAFAKGATTGADTAIATGETSTDKYVGYQSYDASDITIANNSGTGGTDVVTLVVSNSTVVAGESFTLTAPVASVSQNTGAAAAVTTALNGTYTAVAGTGASALKFEVPAATVTVAVATGDITNDYVHIVTNNAGTKVTSAADFVVNPVAGDAAAVGYTSTLTLSTSDTKATLGVQSFLDLNNNNKIDSGEAVSAIRTVNFLDATTVTASAKFQPVLAGATALKADVTLSGDVNYGQLAAGAYTVVFKSKDATDYTNTMGLSDINVVWDSVKGVYRATSGTIAAVYAGASYQAKVYLGASSAALLKATTTSDVDAALTGPTLVSKVVASATAKNTAVGVVDGGTIALDPAISLAAGAAATTVKVDATAGAAPVTVSLFVGADAKTLAGISGKTISVTATSTGVTLSDAAKVNGTSIVTGTANTFTLTSGSDGYATFVVDGASVDDTDTIVINAVAGGVSFAPLTITYNVAAPVLYGVNVAERSILAGSKYTLDYKVVDQWGSPAKNGKYQVLVTPNGNERTTAATFTVQSEVVDGLASVTITDNGVGLGKTVASAKLTLVSDLTAIGSTVDTNVRAVADATSSKIVLDALAYGTTQKDETSADAVDHSKKLLLSNTTFKNYDSRFAVPTDAAPKATTGTAVTLSGTVTNAAGAVVAGAPVTIAAKGFEFYGDSRYGADTITVLASATGTFSVKLWSNVGGAQTVTVAAGAATASQALTFEAGVASAKTVAFDGPTAAQSGRAVQYTATILDSYGNPAQGVSVTFTTTGVGYLAQSVVATGVDGKAVAKLIVGSTETGDATVVAKVTDVDGVDVLKSLTTIINNTDATVDIVNNRVTAVASFSKGKTVAFYVDGVKKWSKTSASDADVVLNYNLKKGTHTVTVKISGGFVTTEKFIVK
jgi:hypothetical protein